MKKFFKEFKDFISRGNVFDMAVGLIIATAFNKIVSSLVNDIIMPLVTWLTGAASLADLSLPLRWNAEGVVTLSWAYGNFIQTIIDFLIIAFSIFCMVKVVNGTKKKLEEINGVIVKTSTKQYKAERKAVKKLAKEQNKSFKVAWQEHEAEKQKLQEEAKQKAQAEQQALELAKKLENPSEVELLKEIRDLLKNNASKDAGSSKENNE